MADQNEKPVLQLLDASTRVKRTADGTSLKHESLIAHLLHNSSHTASEETSVVNDSQSSIQQCSSNGVHAVDLPTGDYGTGGGNKKKARTGDLHRICPYLDTIDRAVLDFDFEKQCSVSLSHQNVYACLVCGKYFQGRGQATHAYTHALQESHHMFLNLLTLKFYCLPENYEVVDQSLQDITFNLKPSFRKVEVAALDTNTELVLARDQTLYLPGIVGLNNIKANDYCNVILQILCRIPPLRDFFLLESNYINLKRPAGDTLQILTARFGELLRKLWHSRRLKSHVSPHEMLQAIVLCSKKKFQIIEQSDALVLLTWFLNTLHLALNGTKAPSSSIVYGTFQGSMTVFKRKLPPVEAPSYEQRALTRDDPSFRETSETKTFLYLTLDLPASPLFKDEMSENFIPQVPLFTILRKFSGLQESELNVGGHTYVQRFEITHLPPYLIICMKRFVKNRWFIEKNPTIVNFPIKNVDFGEFMSSVAQKQAQQQKVCTKYSLLANVVHEGGPDADKGAYKAFVLHKGTMKWYEIQDLHVTEVLPQTIPLTESYIQVWERSDLQGTI